MEREIDWMTAWREKEDGVGPPSGETSEKEKGRRRQTSVR